MAYIIFADQRSQEVVNKATSHLRNRGHQVDVIADGMQLMEIVARQQPDVIVLSFFIQRKNGLDVAQDLRQLYPQSAMQFLWIAILAPDGSGPAFGWNNTLFANAILESWTEWQFVLAVEQLLYRRVTFITSN